MFRELVKLSGLPINMGTGKYHLLNKKGGAVVSQSNKIVKLFNDPNEMLQRLAVLIGEKSAGNNNDNIRNEMMEILDILLKKGILTKTDHRKIYLNYLN